jgi:AraC family transcriptional activator of pobA
VRFACFLVNSLHIQATIETLTRLFAYRNQTVPMQPPKIPVHELEPETTSVSQFDFIELLPKTGKSTTVPHRHDYYELFFFTNGGGTHLIDFKEFNITPCSLHLVAPGQVHHLKRSNHSVGYALLFEESFLYNESVSTDFISLFSYMEIDAFRPVFEFSEQEFHDIMQLVLYIEKEYQVQHSFSPQVIGKLLQVIILNCRRKTQENHGVHHTEMPVLYSDFRKLLNQQYKTFKKVKDYADLLNTTERTLNEVSKKRSGKNASNLIFDRIVIEAKRLLANTQLSVKEICFELQYDDPAHFSKFFKSKSGYTPSAFRELYKS